MSRSPADSRNDAGFSLVELLIVAVLGIVLLVAIYQTIIIQERSYRAEYAITSVQENMRLGTDVLASALREVSANATSGDIRSIAADSITFREFRKIGILCDTISNGAHFDILQAGDAFSDGDSLLVFIDNNVNKQSDDEWRATYVSGMTGSSGKCTNNWAGYTMQQVQLPSAVLTGVRQGAPVRSFVWMTYGLYQDSSGNWMLGRHDADSTAVSMLAGPLAPPDSGGLTFTYYDKNNNVTTDPADVVRLVITLKGTHRTGPEMPNGVYMDTLTTQVFLRNDKVT